MSEQLSLDFETRLSQEETALLGLLRPGRFSALGVGYLAPRLGATEKRIRELVRHLIISHGYCIGSAVTDPAGFFIAETPEEIADATRSLRHRGIRILMRAAKLQRNSVEHVFHQARLEFTEGDEE